MRTPHLDTEEYESLILIRDTKQLPSDIKDEIWLSFFDAKMVVYTDEGEYQLTSRGEASLERYTKERQMIQFVRDLNDRVIALEKKLSPPTPPTPPDEPSDDEEVTS